MSPMKRSLDYLRAAGWRVWVVEQQVKRRIKRDLFNFGDILAIRDGAVMAVQTTTLSNVSNREKKAAENEHVPAMKRAGIKLIIHGWRELKDLGWKVKEIEL